MDVQTRAGVGMKTLADIMPYIKEGDDICIFDGRMFASHPIVRVTEDGVYYKDFYTILKENAGEEVFLFSGTPFHEDMNDYPKRTGVFYKCPPFVCDFYPTDNYRKFEYLSKEMEQEPGSV